MPAVSERCAVCGRAVERSGYAKVYVHADQFHQRLNHQAMVARAPIRVLDTPVGRRRSVIDLREEQPVSA